MKAIQTKYQIFFSSWQHRIIMAGFGKYCCTVTEQYDSYLTIVLKSTNTQHNLRNDVACGNGCSIIYQSLFSRPTDRVASRTRRLWVGISTHRFVHLLFTKSLFVTNISGHNANGKLQITRSSAYCTMGAATICDQCHVP